MQVLERRLLPRSLISRRSSAPHGTATCGLFAATARCAAGGPCPPAMPASRRNRPALAGAAKIDGPRWLAPPPVPAAACSERRLEPRVPPSVGGGVRDRSMRGRTSRRRLPWYTLSAFRARRRCLAVASHTLGPTPATVRTQAVTRGQESSQFRIDFRAHGGTERERDESARPRSTRLGRVLSGRDSSGSPTHHTLRTPKKCVSIDI